MGCCGGEPERDENGVVKDRKCRDVLCLILFIAFWGGMFVICGIAAKEGDPARLVYGVDSNGFTCGSKTTYRNQTVDLTARKNLYYLNPLELLTVVNIPYAKTVCVDGCPGAESACNIDALPCKNATQYRCPYYQFAPNDIYGRLQGVSELDTTWYSALGSMSGATSDSSSARIVSKLQSLNFGWVNDWLATFNLGNTGNGTVTGAYYQLKSQLPNNGPCYPVWVGTTDLFHRCYPAMGNLSGTITSVGNAVGQVANKEALTEDFNKVSSKFDRYVADISKGILVIVVGGLVGGVVLSLVWMVILRYASGLMVWLTLLLVNLALLGITLYCFSLAGLLGDNSVSKAASNNLPSVGDPTKLEKSTWKAIAIAAAVVAGVVLLITLLMISRVRIAIACIKVASQAVGAMPLILLFPLLPFVFEVGLLIYWVAVTALLYSAGDLTAHCRPASDSFSPFSFSNFSSTDLMPTWSLTNATSVNTTCYTNMTKDDMSTLCAGDPNCYLSYDWNNKLKYAFIYHFFGLLWTNQFIVGVSCVTIAGAIGSFYWAHGEKDRLPRFPVLGALKNTIVYHLGSIAFGALIIAIIQFIRALLDYMDRKTKKLQEGNALAKWAMCCVKCCMWCLEKIVKFINRNAYIIIGIKGTNYCVSAGRAIKLIISNVLRIAAINIIGDVLIFLGKIAVAAGCGLIAFGMCQLQYYSNQDKYPDTYLYSPVLPVAISILTGFVVAEIFFAVYEMAIETVLLSFCEDCEVHGGNPKFAPSLLMDAMGVADDKVQPKAGPIKG